jgi:hypothetical protein
MDLMESDNVYSTNKVFYTKNTLFFFCKLKIFIENNTKYII